MSSEAKLCFNSNCKGLSDEWRRGWRRRTGDYANLCDRCSSAYEDGKFCETFHMNASGWRCCESCGKQIHCGCIVSFHMFVLLDAGGIECLTCARKSYILTPNPAWPPPSHFLPSQSERMKEFSVKSLSAIAGSGPVPLHKVPCLVRHFDVQSDAQTKRSNGRINILSGIEWIPTSEGISSPERRGSSSEILGNGNLKIGSLQKLGNSGLDMREHSYSFNNNSKPALAKNDSCSPNVCLATASLPNKKDDLHVSAVISQTPAISGPSRKQACLVGMESFGERQMSNGKSQADGCGRNQLLPRYHPRITDEELQQISTNTKAVITPLFEKMLSASDAGRVGRLVLPKKCAEAYFPRIVSPEGLPLKVLDAKGKEWVFQFRFWPNNNSRMYVLEGITPCIHSLQLRAGDVVTFSWLALEGKFVIGGRKSSAIQPAEQGDDFTIIGNDASAPGDGSSRNKFRVASPAGGHVKGKIHKDNPMPHTKRKNDNLIAKSKRLRINTEDMIELKLTLKEAQRLMRPTARTERSIFIVEGCEFEEFEDDEPVVGRPTILGDDFGKEIQWVQCEECCKWRKVPADALLLSRWICSDNVWDVGRSLCSAVEELSKEQLQHMLPTITGEDYAIKKETSEQESGLIAYLEGVDPLANLAIQGEGGAIPASSEAKHSRHRIGCACIFCLQPCSTKSYNHKQSCQCTSCILVRRRFRTLMEGSEKKQFECGDEPSSSNLCCHQLPDKIPDVAEGGQCSTLNHEEVSKWDYLVRKSSTSPLKGQKIIDLNIQPEREEGLSPDNDCVPSTQSIECSGDGLLLPQRSLNHTSDTIRSVVRNQIRPDGIGGTSLIRCMALDGGGHLKSG